MGMVSRHRKIIMDAVQDSASVVVIVISYKAVGGWV